MYTEQDISNLLKEIQSLKDEMTRMKKIQRRSRMKMLMTVLLVPLVTVPILIFAATLSVPNTYTTGQTIYASSMNQNFSAITDRINAMWNVNGTDLTYSAGNVGIGTGSPGIYKLNVSGSVDGSNLMLINNTHANGSGLIIETGGTTSAPAFYVTSNNGATTVLRAQNDGNVGIGTASPITTLTNTTAKPSTYISDKAFLWSVNDGTYKAAACFYNEHSTGTALRLQTAGTGAENVLILNSGSGNVAAFQNDRNVVIHNLAGSGNRAVYSDPSGFLTNSTSDGRLKKNVENIPGKINVIEVLKKLRGVYFNWKEDNDISKRLGRQREMGMIAEEVEKVLPELVGKNDNGYKSFDYPKLVSFLVEVNKEQQKRLESLESRLAALEGRSGTEKTAVPAGPGMNASLKERLWALVFE